MKIDNISRQRLLNDVTDSKQNTGQKAVCWMLFITTRDSTRVCYKTDPQKPLQLTNFCLVSDKMTVSG